MKRIVVPLFAIVIGVVLASGTSHANPCVCPKRMIRGYTVNLQPLMDWWQQPKGARPLSAWRHVQGVVVRDDPRGWIIEGKPGDDGQAYFLKNPPRDRLRRFQELQQELSECERASAVIIKLLNRPIVTTWFGSYPVGRPVLSFAEYHDAAARLSVIRQRMADIDSELAPLRETSGEFKVDVFAMKCDESFEGVPVYDHGSTAPFGY